MFFLLRVFKFPSLFIVQGGSLWFNDYYYYFFFLYSFQVGSSFLRLLGSTSSSPPRHGTRLLFSLPLYAPPLHTSPAPTHPHSSGADAWVLQRGGHWQASKKIAFFSESSLLGTQFYLFFFTERTFQFYFFLCVCVYVRALSLILKFHITIMKFV